jgi:hypothetical protein
MSGSGRDICLKLEQIINPISSYLAMRPTAICIQHIGAMAGVVLVVRRSEEIPLDVVLGRSNS